MVLDYDILKKRDGIDILWEGIVRLSQSFVDCMTEPVVQDDMKIYTFYDRRFDREDNAQFDNLAASKNFPNKVTIVLKGSGITEFMKCSAFTRQERFETKRPIKSTKGTKITLKGFFLEPLQHTDMSEYACLSVFQFDNENSSNQTVMQLDSVDLKHSLIVEKLGCVAFASGSRGSGITFSRDPKKSVTILYVASDRKPFIVRLDTNQNRRRVVCRSDGAKMEADSPAGHLQNPTPKKPVSAASLDEALNILNIRLAKGEITIYEYENLRRVMESHTDQASTNWWA